MGLVGGEGTTWVDHMETEDITFLHVYVTLVKLVFEIAGGFFLHILSILK